VHRVGYDEYFDQLWSTFDLQPRELEIRPNVRFDLGKTYDLITIMKSNVFWKTEEVIHYDGTTVGIAWQNQGADNKYHTYFSVYNKEDWEFFVDNIKEFLNPGGIAIVNPDPWPYDVIESYKSTADYLKQFQTDNLPVDQILHQITPPDNNQISPTSHSVEDRQKSDNSPEPVNLILILPFL
jgi:hypothetical protein